MGVPPVIIHISRWVFHYKASSYCRGNPHLYPFMEPPNYSSWGKLQIILLKDAATYRNVIAGVMASKVILSHSYIWGFPL